jgi:Domain of unknown function (DUF4389)
VAVVSVPRSATAQLGRQHRSRSPIEEVVVIAGVFAVVFSGKYPVGLRNFLVGVSWYNLRLQAYAGLLNDQYPPFTLS